MTAIDWTLSQASSAPAIGAGPTSAVTSGPPPGPTKRPGHLGVLAAVVRDLAAQEETWLPQVRFERGTRWWTRLEGPPGIDVWLLSWLTTQGTELHDHGDSAAAFTVVQGALTEVRAAGGQLTTQHLRSGDVQTVAPAVVHDVVNRESRPAVSIHAYAPRLTRMTYYRWGVHGLTVARSVTTTEPESAR